LFRIKLPLRCEGVRSKKAVRIIDDLNLYTYVGNDPLDKNDPSGNESAGVAYSSITQLADVRAADFSPE
jgi:hypothetical protein